MDLGKNIKNYRIKMGLSQKDLADKLFVTYQAVSRWENDQVEPSIDTLNSMAKIFNCSINDLVNGKTEDVEEKTEDKQINTTPIKVVNNPPKQIIAFCDKCDKPIYEMSDLKRLKVVSQGSNFATPGEEKKYTYCLKCYNQYLQKKANEEHQKVENKNYELKHKRNLSFVLSSICSFVVLLIGVLLYCVGGYSVTGIFFMVSSVPTFTFVGTMVLDNTFLNEFWFGATELGFVKMPGIIFTFDIGGFIFLIVMKILFAIIGFLIGVAVFLFATGVSYFLSLFAYPLAIKRNLDERPTLNSVQNFKGIKEYVNENDKSKNKEESK